MALEGLRRLPRSLETELGLRLLPISGYRKSRADSDGLMQDQAERAAWPDIRSMAQQDFGLDLVYPEKPALGRDAALMAAWIGHEAPEIEVEFHSKVFAARFRDRADIDDWDILANIAKKSGLDARPLPAILRDSRLQARLEADAETAREMGITAVPSYLIGERHLVLGAQTSATLTGTLRQIESLHRLDPSNIPSID